MISFPIDDKEKNELDSVLEKIPDEDAFYSEANQIHLKKSIKRLEAGEGQIHDLITL